MYICQFFEKTHTFTCHTLHIDKNLKIKIRKRKRMGSSHLHVLADLIYYLSMKLVAFNYMESHNHKVTNIF
jgi:hypothetical protein